MAPASEGGDRLLRLRRKNLYVVFVCQRDPPRGANMTKREAIMGTTSSPCCWTPIRPSPRIHFPGELLGIQMDGVTTEGQDDDYSFDTLWHSDGRLTPDGFVTSIAVPFKSLRFPDAERQIWGFGLGRIIPQNNETSFWPEITRRIESFGSQLATLEGLERISPGRNLQFIPYAAGTTAHYLDEEAVQFEQDRGRIGLDTKVVVKDALPST
jgi:hypothetical protein